MRQKKINGVNPEMITGLLLIGGGIIAFSLISKTLESVGIWQSADSKSLDNAAANAGSPWNPNFYTQFSSFNYALDTQQATDLSNKIYDSFGVFNDCEDCVKAVFYSLQTQSEVSFLSKVFTSIYNQDLLSYLRGGLWPQDHLSDSDVSAINKFVMSLPKN